MHQRIDQDPSNPSAPRETIETNPLTPITPMIPDSNRPAKTKDLELIRKSTVEVEFGICSRPGCEYRSNRCNVAYCVMCCKKYHEHIDPRNEATGAVGYRAVLHKRVSDATPTVTPLAPYRAGYPHSHMHHPLPLVSSTVTDVTPPKENVPSTGKVVREDVPMWADTQIEPTWLNEGEKKVVTSQEFKEALG